MLLNGLLTDLCNLETQTTNLTKMAYEWCSVVCHNSFSHADQKDLLLLSLEIGFRHLKPQPDRMGPKLTHTHHNQQIVDIIFGTGDAEAITDLLHACTLGYTHDWPHTLLQKCAKHLTSLRSLQPFSPRLKKLVIRAITFLGYQGFKQVGVEGFVGLLNNLHGGMDDMGGWVNLLLDIIRSPEGACHLSLQHWEFLVEFISSGPWWVRYGTYSPNTMMFLKEAGEWGKLECWMGIAWLLWLTWGSVVPEEDLKHMTALLFHQRPGAIQKLEGWIEKWCRRKGKLVPESFQLICEQSRVEMAHQDVV